MKANSWLFLLNLFFSYTGEQDKLKTTGHCERGTATLKPLCNCNQHKNRKLINYFHCIKNNNVFFSAPGYYFFLRVILEYERHISVSQFWQRSGKQMMKIKEIEYDLEDTVCLASLQKCFATATSEVYLTWCVRYSGFALIPRSRRREKYLTSTCCRPTNKKKVSPWNAL